MNQLEKTNRILLFILLIVVFLYWGAPFLIPFIFGIFFAFLMVPLCNFLEKTRMNRTIASLVSTLVLFILFGGTLLLFSIQIKIFVSDIPSMEDKVLSFIESSQNRIESITNLSLGEQDKILEERSGQIIEKIEPFVTGFFGSLFSTVFSFLLVLVYLFLLLLYRAKIFDFLMMYVSQDQDYSAKEILGKISKVAFHYLWGRAQVMILLGIMFFITFLLFGLPHALLFTLFGAVITIIPIFGPLISGLLPIMFAFLYVKLNPLIIIVAIVVGGIMWGLAGMILFVPMIAMVKIVSLNHSGLKPIGFLLGQNNS